MKNKFLRAAALFVIMAVMQISSIAQTITVYSPGNNSGGLNIHTNIILTFDMNVNIPVTATGYLNVANYDEETSIQTLDKNSTELSVGPNSNQITINLQDSLPYNTMITLALHGNLFNSSNGFYSGLEYGTYKFSTQVDIFKPYTEWISPANNLTNFPPHGNLLGELNEDVMPGTGTIFIKEFSTDNIVESFSPSEITGNNMLGINPTLTLAENTKFYVEVPNGAILDLAGNAFAGFSKSTWNFTTGEDTNSPSLEIKSPEYGASGVSVSTNILLSFDENIQAGTGAFQIYETGGSLLKTIMANSPEASFSGNEVTLTPLTSLPENTQLYIKITEFAVQDMHGHYYDGINSSNGYTFETGAGATAPAIVALSPEDNTTSVASSSNISLTFNKEIQNGSGYISLHNYGTNQIIESFNIETSSVVDIASNTITINPSSTLSGKYYVTIQNGAIQSSEGAPYLGFSDKNTWNFTTETTMGDITHPNVVSMNPANNTTGIPLDQAFTITFNEDMMVGQSGSFSMFDASNGEQLGSTWSLPSMLSVSGNQVTVTYPTGLISDNQAVYFVISEMGISDLEGNIWPGFSPNEYSLTFSDTDITAPEIVSLSPANGATDVALSANLTLTATEDIFRPVSSNIYFSKNGSTIKTLFTGDPSVSFSGNTMTITNALEGLENNTTYSILVLDNHITDGAGNGMLGTSGNAWEFTTATIVDATAPLITSLTPANGAINISLSADLFLTADEDLVTPTSGNILIQQGGSTVNTIPFTAPYVSFSGNTISISNALQGLNNSTEYSVILPNNAVKDNAGNGMLGTNASTWSFTTEEFIDVTGPQVVSISPANNSTEIPLDEPFVITFDEDVQEISSGIFRMFDANTGAQLAITLAMPGLISVSGNQVTVNYPAGQIAPGQRVYFTLSAAGIEDLAGNTWAGFGVNDYTLTYESPDITAPQILSLTPENGTTGVEFNSNLILFTDEAMLAPTEGNILIKQGTSIVKTIPFTDASVFFSGNTMTIGNALLGLDFSTEYFVEISPGAITDIAGNGMTGTNASNWSFITEAFVDEVAPQIVSISPANGSTGIALDQPFTITFDEAIQAVNSGSIAMYESESDVMLGTNWFLPNLVSVSENQATISFPEGYTSYEQSVYFVLSGAIEDLAGNTWAGISANEYTVTYETQSLGDITAPSITNISPSNETTEVPIDQPLVITFDENIQEINSGSFAMFESGTNVQLGTNWFLPALTTISGNQATITYPTGYISAEQSVYFVLSGTIQDMAGNFWAGFSPDEYTITFGGGDNTAPTISSLFPANTATNVSLTANLILTADEEIQQPATGSILIKQGVSTVNTIPFNDASVSFSGNLMTITDALSGLNNSTQYSIEISDNAITDLAENGMLGTNNTSWSFTTEALVDITPPQIVNISPANGSTGITIDQAFVITFDEDIVEHTDGGIQLFEAGTNTQITANVFAPNYVTVSGNQATITYPSGYVQQSQSVYFVISTIIRDLAGNSWAGFAADDYTLTYEFLDEVSPTVTNYEPSFNETEIPLNSDLVLSFDEDVYASGLGAVSIKENGVTRFSISMTDPSISFEGNQMTVATPLLSLNYETEYTVHIVPAAIIDISDNYFSGTDETTWKFTTEMAPDVTPPNLVSIIPDNEETNATLNTPIVLTFDEDIQKMNTGSLSIYESGTDIQIGFSLFLPDFVSVSGNEVTITYPEGYIQPGQSVYFVISSSGLADLAGNTWAGFDSNDYTISFPDTQGPQIVSFSPANGSIDITQDQGFVITFDENIQEINTGSFRIYESGTNTQLGVNWYLPNLVEVSGNQATFTYPQGFTSAGQTVFFAITGAGIQDMAGNEWAGLAFDQYTITYAELNIPSPEIVSTLPSHNELGVSLTSNLVLTTNHDIVVPATGNILIKEGSTTVNSIPYNDASVSFDASQLTITNALLGLNYGRQYYVEIAENAIEGLTGNGMEATNSTNWAFTTETFIEATFPDIVSLSPADGAMGVILDSDLVMTIANNIVIPTSGSIIISDSEGVVVTIPLSDVSVDFTNNVMTISNALLDLNHGTLYTVQIIDVSRGTFRGVNSLLWSFTTEECLIINDITTTITETQITANQTGATYQWLDCNNGNAVINGATSQTFSVTTDGSYACEIVNGCSTDITDCVVMTGVSVETDNKLNSLVLYPNPAKNRITIIGIESQIQDIRIVNFSGKFVKTESIDNTTINISELPAGIYILQIFTENGLSTQRFIKE